MRRISSALYATLAIALSLIVYAPILKNYFWLDDFLILELLTNWPLGKFLTVSWAGHLVLVRNAFYAGTFAVVGANPMPYYLALLALHCLNVGLVFAVVSIVTRSAPLACLAAAAWGTCPLNEGALGWIAASGNVMVATTTLAVLYDAVRAEWRQARVGLARAGLWAALLLAGAQSFGTGLGVALVAPFVLAWLAWNRLTRAARVVLVGVPAVTGWMYGADYSEFTGRLGSSVVAKTSMLIHLLAVGISTLIKGLVYEPSPSEFVAPVGVDLAPLSFSVAVYAVTAVVISLWATAAVRWSTGRTRRLLIAVGVLALGNYGVIAVGRAYWIEALHQSVVRWTVQTRYHYSATALLAIGIAVVIASLLGNRLTNWARPVLIAWLALFAILYARTGWTIRHYDAERERAERILTRIDAAIRATPAGEPVVTYNEPFLDGPFVAGAASLYVMNRSIRYSGEPDVYFVDSRATTVWSKYPESPLAHAMLLPPAARLACGARFTFQSDGQ